MEEGWRLDLNKKDAMLANWEAADAEVSLWDMGACKPVPAVWRSATANETIVIYFRNRLIYMYVTVFRK